MKRILKTAAAGRIFLVFVMAVWLTGCGSSNTAVMEETMDHEEKTGETLAQNLSAVPDKTGVFSDSGYILPDGLYSLSISENEWQVEEDDDGDLLFISKEDDSTVFSLSKWENTALPPETEFENYYDQYLEGIREDHPEAEKTSYDVTDISGSRSLYMGIRYRMDGEEYRVLMYLIPVLEGRDLLSLTMTVPEAGADTSEEIFRSVAEGIHPVKGKI